MLPIIYCQAYETLLDRLSELAIALQERDTDQRDRLFQEIQTWMKTRILSLTDDNLTSAEANRWRSIHTEIHRSWRLLETDWLFLASSRQNSEKRLAIIGDRLATLSQYCRILLEQ